MAFNYGKVQIEWLGHSSFRFSSGGKVIYVDPYKLDENPYSADLVLITHEHNDHCAVDNIQKIMKEGTVVVAPQNCLTKLSFVPRQNLILMAPKDSKVLGRVQIYSIPAYNVNKFRSPGIPFHPKGYGLGYIFTFDGVKIYHAGDTDFVPEVRELATSEIDIALLPVGGIYTMGAREAAEAAKIIKSQLVIPMHWGAGIVGSQEDANKFKELVGDVCEVRIL
jgi:L-ascorbate metabolism protein UlaG (beta-lactamase superfamily)